MRKILSIILCLSVLAIGSTALTGCTIRHDVQLQKFDVYTNDIQINHNTCIKITTPENAGFIEVENLNFMAAKGLNIMLNLDDSYILVKQLFEEVLQSKNLSCDKSMNITIDKVQYETWGFLGDCQGAYMYFTIETSNGIRKSFKVQDQSGWDFERAISGTLSRLVETTLKDRDISNYINEH